ncbi:uncharacterized protein LOC106011048 [Aplysia californica]|uniref:Uncharacterized protein LOC106011048 n=1 Tax=Aplysia californica TaxID=6500 RepID=A0ABM0ZUJ0_APLCA|nr:uncharacterized protein LOC106011048 [Aplysia californica]
MKGLEKHREKAQDRMEAGFERENDSAIDDVGEKRLVTTMLAAATASVTVRRKRAVAEGALTCDLVKHLRGSVKHLDSQMLNSMTETEFKNCLSAFGHVSDMPDETINALVARMKQLYGGVDTWSNEAIRRAGVIISGLSPAEIQLLQLTGVDAMNSVARHGRLTAEQLKAGFRRWLSLSGVKDDITKVNSGKFSSLSEFVCGLEMSDITALAEETFKRSLEVVGHSSTCPPEIKQAYANKAAVVYGTRPPQWPPALVGDMGHLIGALSTEHVSQLTPGQLALVTPTVIQKLPESKLVAMSVAQLSALSPNQANAVTEGQFSALSQDQRDAVAERANVAFHYKPDPNEGTGGGSGDGGNGAPEMNISRYFLAVVAALVVFIM